MDPGSEKQLRLSAEAGRASPDSSWAHKVDGVDIYRGVLSSNNPREMKVSASKLQYSVSWPEEFRQNTPQEPVFGSSINE